jgi:hypothetical protein
MDGTVSEISQAQRQISHNLIRHASWLVTAWNVGSRLLIRAQWFTALTGLRRSYDLGSRDNWTESTVTLLKASCAAMSSLPWLGSRP